MRGQESGSEHERETDGSAAPATPPPSFGRPTVQAPSAFQESAYSASHGDALAGPPFADLPAGQVIDSGTAPARPPIPVYQGPPPDLPAPEPATAPDAGHPLTPAVSDPWALEPAASSDAPGPWTPEPTPQTGTPWTPEPLASSDTGNQWAPTQEPGSPWTPGPAPDPGPPWTPEPGTNSEAGAPWTPESVATSDRAPWAPESAADAGHSPAGEGTGRPAPVEDATIERPRPDRQLPAFPGVPAETWSTAAQPWEQADDGQPYDWYADPEPGAETPWGPPQPGSPSASPSGPQQQATWAPPGAQQPPALGAPLPPGAPYPPAPGQAPMPGAAQAPISGPPMPGAGQAPMPGSPQPPAFGAQHAPLPSAPQPPAFGAQHAPLPGAPQPGGTQPGAPQPAAAWPQPEPPSPWAPDQSQAPWTPASGEVQTPWAPPHADQAPQTEWQQSPGPQAEWQPSPGPQAEWQPSSAPQAGPWTPSPGPQAEPWKPSPAAWQTEPDQADSTWQPPQAFTAAAAGMKVWPSHTTDAPAMPPWPAATGEPIDDHDGSQEAQADDPNATVSFAHSAEPGDVPVWPPHPQDADQADDRIPDLPFDSATWGRPKGDAPPADVLDDVPGDRAATPETADPTPSGSPTAGASGSGTSDASTTGTGTSGTGTSSTGTSGTGTPNAGAAAPSASPTAAPGNDSSPNDPSGNSGSGSDMSGSAASGNDMSGNGAFGNAMSRNGASEHAMSGNGAPGDDMSGNDVSGSGVPGNDTSANGTTASDSPDDHPFPTDGAIPLPAIPPTAGLPALPAPPAGAPAAPPAVPGGSPAADLPTPPHGAPAATFDPFSPLSQGGIAPPAQPAVKEPSKGKKALIASLGVLVVAGVATGGFFAYRSMSTGQPTGPSASGAPSSVPSVSGTDDPLANSLLNSEGTDPEKMSINEAFPEQKVDIGGRVYTRVKVDMSDDCKLAAAGPFATALQDQKCSRVLRATYVDDKKRYAISTGIAVLPTKEAAAAADQAKDLDKNLWFRPLPGAASSGADRVHIAGGYAAGLLWGRYIVFSYATYADGHTPTAKEKGLGDVSGAFRDHTSLVLERRITE